ncbi:MAG: prefoldin subunit alpha [Candidatus Aenigmatarchaeota archaeon]
MADEKKKELRQKLMLYQFLKSSVESFYAQLQDVNNKIMEMNVAVNVIDEIRKLKAGEDLLIPIGAGCFIASKSDKVDEILVSLGADVISKKNSEEAKDVLKSRLKEFEKAQKELSAQLQTLSTQLQALEPEMAELSNES